MTEAGKTEPMACRRCNEALNAFRAELADGAFTGEIQYVHVFQDAHDHAPEPRPAAEVPEEDLVFHCDFCSSTAVKWCYWADPIKIAVLDDEDRVREESGFSIDWAACQRCADLIVLKAIDRLADRAVSCQGLPADMREPLIDLYIEFFATRKPGRRRIKRRRI